MDDIAKMVKGIEPFIRTENEKLEINELKENLAKPRKRLNITAIEARRIPGMEQNDERL